MAITNTYQKTYEEADIESPGNVIHFKVVKTGTLVGLKIYVDEASGTGDTDFGLTQLTDDGATAIFLYTNLSPITLPQGDKVVALSGLEIDVTADDVLILRLENAPIDFVTVPLAIEYEIDEGLETEVIDAVSAALIAGDNVTIDVDAENHTVTISSTGGGGGGGSPIGVWSPDKVPTSPSAVDDEFDGESLGGDWITIGASDLTITPKPDQSLLKFSQVASATNKVSGIVRPYSFGTNEEFIAKMSFTSLAANYVKIGMIFMVTANDSSEIQFVNMYYSTNAFRPHYISKYTNRSTFTSYTSTTSMTISPGVGLIEVPYSWFYMKVRKTADSWTVFLSVDGIYWRLTNTVTISSYTPAYFGLGISNEPGSNADIVGYFDWIRKYTHGIELIGGTV